MPSQKKQIILNRNEVLQGPSPRAIAAMHNFPSSRANLYFPGYYGSLLAPELSKKFGVPADRIIVGYGAEDILRRVFDTLDPSRDTALFNELHFDFYHIYLAGRGVRFHEFRLIEGEKEFSFDVDECIAKIREFSPRLVLITSPNNPTGNTLSAKDLARILKAAPARCIVAVDEAYYGFDADYEEKEFLALLRRHGNLMFIRTFSKLYALAGLRIGYALCGKDVRAMLGHQHHRLGGSRILEEIAVAALRSPAYYRALSKEIARERAGAVRSVNALTHFRAFASRGNMFTVKVSPAAKAFLEKEMARAPRLVSKFYSPTLLRVSVAPKEIMEEFMAMMARVDRKAAAMRPAPARPKARKTTTRAPRIRRTVRYRA